MNNLEVLILSGIFGATLTFYVSENFNTGPIRSSALLSIGVALFFYGFPNVFNSYLTKNIPLVFMGTSFIGMVSSKYYGSYFNLGVAGILFSIIYSIKSLFFEGFGGALGALAFISLLTVISFSTVFARKRRMKRGYVRIRNGVVRRMKFEAENENHTENAESGSKQN